MNQWLFVLYVGYVEYGSVMPSVLYMTGKNPRVYAEVHILYGRGHMRHELYKIKINK